MSASAGVGAAAPVTPLVRPELPRLAPGPAFDFDEKTRRSVSGIACEADGAKRRCLVVFDEGVRAQFATLGTDGLEPTGPTIGLIGSGKELDAEGAAMDGTYFYVVGSHSVKRDQCKSNPSSRHLVRFKAGSSEPAASAPAGSPRFRIEALQDTQRLWDLMTRDPFLSRHADGCLGSGKGGRPEQMKRRPGLNIEGIAAYGGRLYLGFRAPSQAGEVPVYSVDAAALFDGEDARPRLTNLQVGDHAGIRDLVAGHRAILLLLGPDDHEPVGKPRWRVAEWTPDDASATIPPRMLAELDLSNVSFDSCVKELKPEAMAILQETATEYRIAVLSDGVCDGGPLVFKLSR